MTGDAPAAITDARTALDFAHQAGDRRAEWQALIDLGLYWAGRDYARAEPCLDAALDLARSLGDPTLEAHSLNRLGNWRINAEQPRDALPLHHEALAIFERLGDRAGVAATLDLLGMAAYICADLASSMRYYERAAALMEELDDRPGLVTCLALLASRGGSYELGLAAADASDFAAALRDGERAVALAREISWPAGEAFAMTQHASTLGRLGQYRARPGDRRARPRARPEHRSRPVGDRRARHPRRAQAGPARLRAGPCPLRARPGAGPPNPLRVLGAGGHGRACLDPHAGRRPGPGGGRARGALPTLPWGRIPRPPLRRGEGGG